MARYLVVDWDNVAAEVEIEIALQICFGRRWLVPASHAMDSLGALKALHRIFNAPNAAQFRKEFPDSPVLALRPQTNAPGTGFAELAADFLSRDESTNPWMSSALPELSEVTNRSLRKELATELRKGHVYRAGTLLDQADFRNGKFVAEAWQSVHQIFPAYHRDIEFDGTREPDVTLPQLARSFSEAELGDHAPELALELQGQMKACLSNTSSVFNRSVMYDWGRSRIAQDSETQGAFLMLAAAFYHRELGSRLGAEESTNILWDAGTTDMARKIADSASFVAMGQRKPFEEGLLEISVAPDLREVWTSAEWNNFWGFLLAHHRKWSESLDRLHQAAYVGRQAYDNALAEHIALLSKMNFGNWFFDEKERRITISGKIAGSSWAVIGTLLSIQWTSPNVDLAVLAGGFALAAAPWLGRSSKRGHLRRAIGGSVKPTGVL